MVLQVIEYFEGYFHYDIDALFFLLYNRQRYQDFLQKLLAKPTLRSSELLHTFLTVPNLKPYFTNYSTPDIGVLYQSMAHKLRKEKGQHLDKFMSTFLASTNIKCDQPDMGVELDHNFQEGQKKGRDLMNVGPFGNNLNLDPRIQNFPYIVNKLQHTKGVCFCIAEACEYGSVHSLYSYIDINYNYFGTFIFQWIVYWKFHQPLHEFFGYLPLRCAKV